jgi:multidrug efflux pump subunit AcrA (membrane-fusion protein)
MRTEIDLPNDQRLLRQGMYGQVTIHLGQRPNGLSIPSSCVAGDVHGDKGTVFVVKQGVAYAQAVRFGGDNGLAIDVLEGLTPEDEVVLRPSESIGDGVPVEIVRPHGVGKND